MKRTRRRGRPYTLVTALLAGGVMLGVFAVLGVWPFGDGTVLTGDLNALYLNFYAHLRRAVLGQAGFAYGFDKGLGGNLVGLFATYYASPLNLPAALVPVAFLPVLAAAQQLLRVVLACVFCRMFLGARYAALGWGSVGLALCYGLCAYSFAYAQNPMWQDVLLLLPLVCLGLERMCGTVPPAAPSHRPAGAPLAAVASRGFLLYTLALALAIFCNFYTAYMVCIFSVIYFLYIMLLRPRAQRTMQGWRRQLGLFAAGSVLAGGLNAALLLPTLANVGQAKGSLLALSFSLEPLFPLRQLPERLAIGALVDGDMSGHMPFIYCGALVLVLLGCFFVSRQLRAREKLAAVLVLLLFLLSFWLKGPDTLWHGLKAPVGFPARYSFIFSFFCVRLAAEALARGAANRRSLVLSGTFWVAAFVVMAAFPALVSSSRLLATAATAGAFTLLLVLANGGDAMNSGLAKAGPGLVMARQVRPLLRRALAIALPVLLAAELALNGWYSSNRFEKYPLSTYQAFVAEKGAAVKAAQAEQAAQGMGAARMVEDSFRSLNDAMLLGYSGISHFASTQDGPAQQLLYALGYRVYGGGGPYLYGNTAFADSALGIRHLLATGARLVPYHWAAVGRQFGTVTLLQNPTALPMAFTIVPPVAGAEAAGQPLAGGSGDIFAAQAELYGLLGGEGSLWGEAPELSQPDPGTGAEGQSYTITARQAGYHYAVLQLPAGTPISVNGGQLPDAYNTALNAGVVQLGWLQAGQAAQLAVYTGAENASPQALQAVCLPAEKLEALAAYAASGTGDFSLTDGCLSGSVVAEDGRNLLYTSIPWDAGWAAEVNGSPVAPQRFAGGLLALPLREGENDVELKYTAPGSGPVGWAVSALCALLLGAALLFMFRRAKLARPGPKENAE